MKPSKEGKQRDSLQTAILTSLICMGLVMTLGQMASSSSPVHQWQLLVLLLCLFVALAIYSLLLVSYYQ